MIHECFNPKGASLKVSKLLCPSQKVNSCFEGFSYECIWSIFFHWQVQWECFLCMCMRAEITIDSIWSNCASLLRIPSIYFDKCTIINCITELIISAQVLDGLLPCLSPALQPTPWVRVPWYLLTFSDSRGRKEHLSIFHSSDFGIRYLWKISLTHTLTCILLIESRLFKSVSFC